MKTTIIILKIKFQKSIHNPFSGEWVWDDDPPPPTDSPGSICIAYDRDSISKNHGITFLRPSIGPIIKPQKHIVRAPEYSVTFNEYSYSWKGLTWSLKGNWRSKWLGHDNILFALLQKGILESKKVQVICPKGLIAIKLAQSKELIERHLNDPYFPIIRNFEIQIDPF